MISTVFGVLADRSNETVLVETSGGVGYAITLPLGVHERLPGIGKSVRLLTELLWRELRADVKSVVLPSAEMPAREKNSR